MNLLFDLEISEFKMTVNDYLNVEWNVIQKKANYLKNYYKERQEAEKKRAALEKAARRRKR